MLKLRSITTIGGNEIQQMFKLRSATRSYVPWHIYLTCNFRYLNQSPMRFYLLVASGGLGESHQEDVRGGHGEVPRHAVEYVLLHGQDLLPRVRVVGYGYEIVYLQTQSKPPLEIQSSFTDTSRLRQLLERTEQVIYGCKGDEIKCLGTSGAQISSYLQEMSMAAMPTSCSSRRGTACRDRKRSMT